MSSRTEDGRLKTGAATQDKKRKDYKPLPALKTEEVARETHEPLGNLHNRLNHVYDLVGGYGGLVNDLSNILGYSVPLAEPLQQVPYEDSNVAVDSLANKVDRLRNLLELENNRLQRIVSLIETGMEA